MDAVPKTGERPIDMRCPLLGRIIPEEICYEVIMSVDGFFKMSAVPDLGGITREDAKKTCNLESCPYHDLR